MEPFPSPGAKLLVEKTFIAFADNLINHCILIINGIEAHFTELEFYYFDPQFHPDPFVHKHELQNKSNVWYIHTYPNSNKIKTGTRKGIDLCLGRENFYCGILIRGLRIGNEYINGPSKVVDRILSLFDSNFRDIEVAAKELGNESSQPSLLYIRQNDPPDNFPLINITRHGLKIKDNSVGLLKDLQETYIKSKYRFIAKDPALFKSKYSGKENILKESDLSDGEISSVIGWKLTR